MLGTRRRPGGALVGQDRDLLLGSARHLDSPDLPPPPVAQGPQIAGTHVFECGALAHRRRHPSCCYARPGRVHRQPSRPTSIWTGVRQWRRRARGRWCAGDRWRSTSFTHRAPSRNPKGVMRTTFEMHGPTTYDGFNLTRTFRVCGTSQFIKERSSNAQSNSTQ